MWSLLALWRPRTSCGKPTAPTLAANLVRACNCLPLQCPLSYAGLMLLGPCNGCTANSIADMTGAIGCHAAGAHLAVMHPCHDADDIMCRAAKLLTLSSTHARRHEHIRGAGQVFKHSVQRQLQVSQQCGDTNIAATHVIQAAALNTVPLMLAGRACHLPMPLVQA